MTRQIILKFIWNDRSPRVVKIILRKMNKAGGITLLDCGQNCKATIIKTAWYWHRRKIYGSDIWIYDRYMDPQNTIRAQK